MEKLINQVIEIAKNDYSGHFSIYHFTTNVKGCFGTLEEYGEGQNTIRDKLSEMPAFNSLEDLLTAMIRNPKEMEAYNSIPPQLTD
jgi:hypothetical protein